MGITPGRAELNAGWHRVTPVSSGADKPFMTPSTERTLKTLAYAWIAGGLASAFLGWLLVPATLPVGYLTPIVVVGPLSRFD